ncbi:MAG: hypothetical protein ACFE9A_07415 [Candidatus Hodarchaeota archaeon]
MNRPRYAVVASLATRINDRLTFFPASSSNAGLEMIYRVVVDQFPSE